MAGIFFDNKEREERVKDLLGSYHEARESITKSIAAITKEGAATLEALERLQGQGKVANMVSLEEKAKKKMTDEEYKEYQDLIKSFEDTDHDLWVAASVMLWVDVGYAGIMIITDIISRIGSYMLSRALVQAVNAGQVGVQIPLRVQNLAARGARAIRPRANAFHLAEGAPELARVQRLQTMEGVMGKIAKGGKVVGVVLLAANLVLTFVDIGIQDMERDDLRKSIIDVYCARHIVKQLALALESEVFHITDARILLNNRAMKESTLNDVVKTGYMTIEQKEQMMKEYDEQQRLEHEAKSPKGGISLPSDEDVCKVLKKRDDDFHAWQNEDPDFNGLQVWLKEAAKP